jgi:hypothetical protein
MLGFGLALCGAHDTLLVFEHGFALSSEGQVRDPPFDRLCRKKPASFKVSAMPNVSTAALPLSEALSAPNSLLNTMLV